MTPVICSPHWIYTSLSIKIQKFLAFAVPEDEIIETSRTCNKISGKIKQNIEK